MMENYYIRPCQGRGDVGLFFSPGSSLRSSPGAILFNTFGVGCAGGDFFCDIARGYFWGQCRGGWHRCVIMFRFFGVFRVCKKFAHPTQLNWFVV